MLLIDSYVELIEIQTKQARNAEKFYWENQGQNE